MKWTGPESVALTFEHDGVRYVVGNGEVLPEPPDTAFFDSLIGLGFAPAPATKTRKPQPAPADGDIKEQQS